MSKARLLITALFIISFFLQFYFVLIPLNKGYNYFIHFTADLLNKPQRLPAIRSAFPEARFLFIRKLVYVSAFVLLIVFAVAIRYSNSIHRNCIAILQRIKASFSSFIDAINTADKTGKAIFILAVLYLIVQSVWYMNYLPFIHDEAYTISNFVLPGPVAAISFYPYPNNHILFSLFSYPFSFLPLKPEIAFRLPSLIAVVLTCFVLFRLLLVFFKGTIAALGVVMFVFMLPVINYSFFARGYCLVFLFTYLSVFVLIRTVQSNTLYHHGLLVLFSVLGLYTVPSYMYPFAAVYMVCFAYGVISKNRSFITRTIIGGLLCGACTLILYLPVIITSGGWKNFVKVIYVGYDDTVSITKAGAFIDLIYGLPFYENTLIICFIFLFVAISAFVCIKKIRKGKVMLTDSVFFWVCLTGFLMPVISFFIQQKMIAPRTHSYVALFFVGFTFITLKQYVSDRWRMSLLIGITFLFAVMNADHGGMYLRREADNDVTAEIFAKKMLHELAGKDTCYAFELFYLAHIQFRYALAKRPLTVFQMQPNSPSSAAFSINNHYNWIITVKEGFSVNRDTLKKYYVPFVANRQDAVLWKKK